MMIKARAVLVAVSGLAVLATSAPAFSLPVEEYLKLRRQSRYDARLTYDQVQADPTTYNQKVLELRGIVSGSIRRDKNVSFLLTLDNGKGLLLDAPPTDVDIVTGINRQRLRVLVRVSESNTGNVVPLQTLAVAYDADVMVREREAARREAIANARREASHRFSAQPMGSMPSRGYRVRQIAASGALSELAVRVLSAQAQAVYPAYKQYIYSRNPRLTEEELDAITVSILHFSQRYRVDPRLVIAMIIAESDFDPRSTSRKGAMGLGQLMPDEARALKLSNPYDPVENVMGAVDLLKGKLDIFREPGVAQDQMTWRQVVLALAAYNAGAGAVRKYGGVPPYRETQGYVKRIIKIYSELIGGG